MLEFIDLVFFTILFDVLHEKFGLTDFSSKILLKTSAETNAILS